MGKYRRLTRADRIAIERSLEQGKNQNQIAEELGVHKSSISREIRRNKAWHGPYRWRGAHAKAVSQRPHLVDYARKIEGPLEELVIQLLLERLSPEQISCRLKLECAKWSVSHETIYRWIYKNAPELKSCLRWRSRRRQKRAYRKRRAIQKFPRRLIDERPHSAAQRMEPGHWERDLLEGLRGGPALLVLNDRFSRITILEKIESKDSGLVNKTTAKALRGRVVESLTNDNGVEFGTYEELEKLINAKVYYCHPYSSWERGTVENTNGLLRQYFPKKTDFTGVNQSDIKSVENALNKRPRKTLGFRSPYEIEEKKELKIIRSESYYRRHLDKRFERSFKEDMIRELGFFIEN